MRKRPLILAGSALVVVAIVLAVLGVYSARDFWNPAVEIRNSGDKELRSIRCVLSTDDGKLWTERVDSLASGERIVFRRDTSDLYVDSIEFTIGGILLEHACDGLATPRETWVIVVDDKGNITQRYER